MKCYSVERVLSRVFYKYGGVVADHPLPFLLIPIIVTAGLASGFIFLTEQGDTEILYTPKDSLSKDIRATIQTLYAGFGGINLLPRHKTIFKGLGEIIIQHRQQGGSVLDIPALMEISRLHEFVKNITVHQNGDIFTYADLCLMWQGECTNMAADLLEAVEYNKTDILSQPLTYPFSTTDKGRDIFTGANLGMVTLKEDADAEIIQGAELLMFQYWLRFDESSESIVRLWEIELTSRVSSEFHSEIIRVYPASTQLLPAELDKAADGVIPFVAIGFFISVVFAVLSTHTMDSVRAKPWLASIGAVSSGLALGSTIGLMSYIGVPYTHVVGALPFLIFGIALDDMFLLVAAWRRTDVHKTVKLRMSESFSHAAMSITITSVTDALAFCVGSVSNFRSVQIFCLYAFVAVLFDYLYQITFFAASMVLSGYREKKNLHAVTLCKVLPKSQAPSTTYRVCCAGGEEPPESSMEKTKDQDSHKMKDGRDHVIMGFFKNYFGPFVTHRIVAYIIVFLYLVYVGAALWGAVTLQEGVQVGKLAPDGSQSAAFYNLFYNHFNVFGLFVSIVVTKEVDYSKLAVQRQLNRTLSELENSDLYHDQRFTASWLREYLRYIELRDSVLGTHLSNQMTEDVFISILRDEFLKIDDFKQFVPDIVFDNETNAIISSRFHLTTQNTNTSNRERDSMVKARTVVKKSALPLVAHNLLFGYFDQYIELLPTTIRSLGVALAAMFLVALVMIPNPVCSIIVGISVVSIILGVIGFMTHWNIPLDSISMISLLICAGFSVDFSAHISYAFTVAPEASPRLRAISALHTVGMPISQAAVSTILACLVLAFTNSYIFRTLFQTMFLVNVIGLLHGLVFIPVFLMLIVPSKTSRVQGSKDVSATVINRRVISLDSNVL